MNKELLAKVKAMPQEESTLEDFGTVADNIGPKGTISLFANNVTREDKLLMVELKDAKGEILKAYCSPNLGAQIRKEKKSAQEVRNLLASLPIVMTTNKAGEERLKIVLRQGPVITGGYEVDKTEAISNIDELPW